MRLVRYSYPNYRTFVPARGAFSRPVWSGLEGELDRLFDVALDNFSGSPSTRFPVDLYEDKENAFVRAELPGVSRDAINVEVVDGTLTIKAERKTPARDGATAQSFSFNRAVNLPSDVQADKVTAAYENGVLTVTLPKQEEAKPRKITVAVK